MGGVFSVIGERQANFTHECFLSMIEIYNENIRDLLADTKEAAGGKRLEIMRDTLVGMYVKDCTSEPVHTASHCRTLIKQGNATRTTTATGLNDQSSRSHMLVTLTVRTAGLDTPLGLDVHTTRLESDGHTSPTMVATLTRCAPRTCTRVTTTSASSAWSISPARSDWPSHRRAGRPSRRPRPSASRSRTLPLPLPLPLPLTPNPNPNP